MGTTDDFKNRARYPWVGIARLHSLTLRVCRILHRRMKATYPSNEEFRLKALYEYGLLDTAPEQDYDDLARLASRVCGCPIALLVLLDRERQWFKARVGLGVSETHRDYAFCAHAILEPDQVLVVPDAASDPRFSDNPLVTGDPRIQFYAGVPLVNAAGAALGTLCVIDRRTRQLSDEQIHSLGVLGRQATRLMDLRRSSESLAQALSEVKTLEGLLPICGRCKNILDEQGAWQPMETYVEQRTTAGFSRGICPECAKAN